MSPRDRWSVSYRAAASGPTIRPVLKLLTCPLVLLTLGLFIFVLNALMLWLTSWISSALTVDGFFTALLGALVIAVVSTVINWFLPD